MTKERVKGFTLVELMVVIGIIGLLMGILVPVFSGIRERGRQKNCGQGLSSIGRGMMQYSNLINAACLMLPLIEANVSDPCAKISNFSGTDDPNIPINAFSGRNVNAMQNFWPMIVQGMCQEAHFQCPSDSGYVTRKTVVSGAGTDKKYGWTNMSQFSFGVQWCYSTSKDSNTRALLCDPTTTTMDEAAVIMADRNPGGSVGQNGIRPSNHPKDGENVMIRAGGVKFYGKTSDSAAGRENDDIYVNNGTPPAIAFPTFKVLGDKTDYFDTVIVPGYAGDQNTGR